MLLLPPDFLFKELIGFNPLPMISKTISISDRMLRDYKDGKAKPRPRTMERIRGALNSKVRENNPQLEHDIFEVLDSYSKLGLRMGWGPFLDGINAGSYPNILFPETQKLLKKYADCSENFVVKCRHDGLESAVQYLAALELPREIFDDEILRTIINCNSLETLYKILFLTSLELFLYLISSIEAESMKNLGKEGPIGSKLIQFVPIKDGKSTLMPIQRFMLWVQEVFGSKSKLIDILNEGRGQQDFKPKDPDRQIYRWFKGTDTPRLGSMLEFAGYLFPDPNYDDVDRWTSIAPVMIFQKVYNMFKMMIGSSFYTGTEDDILEIFNNYNSWFERFREKYAQAL